jgi:hypothetical protein
MLSHEKFRNDHAPSLFVVYAHENRDSKKKANAAFVIELISWLKEAGVTILSDRSPLPSYTSRHNEVDAVRNIISNQLCILPEVKGPGRSRPIQSVDKVLLCSSELLREYSQHGFAEPYMSAIQQTYAAYETSQNGIRDTVARHRRDPAFHHVLTELAFLQLRKSKLGANHGIIPLTLDDADLDYLSIFQHTDLRLKLSGDLASRHLAFFKTLLQIFPEQHEFISLFRKCYSQVTERQAASSTSDDRRSLIVREEIRKTDELWHDYVLRYSRGQSHKAKELPQVRASFRCLHKSRPNMFPIRFCKTFHFLRMGISWVASLLLSPSRRSCSSMGKGQYSDLR